MKTKKKVKKASRTKNRHSSEKILFLSLILLFIIFEAIYILKSQAKSFQASSYSQQQVAGVKTQR